MNGDRKAIHVNCDRTFNAIDLVGAIVPFMFRTICVLDALGIQNHERSSCKTSGTHSRVDDTFFKSRSRKVESLSGNGCDQHQK